MKINIKADCQKYFSVVLFLLLLAGCAGRRNIFTANSSESTREAYIPIPFLANSANGPSYFYFTDNWYADTGTEVFLGGKIIVQLIFLEIIDANTVKIEVFKTMTGFGQMILERTIARGGGGRYEFNFTDGWDNEAHGYFSFNIDGTITFFLDCNAFSENGKNLARLYGDTYTLKRGSMEN